MNRRDVLKQITIGGTTLMILPLAFTSCEKESPDDGPGNGGGSRGNIEIDLTSSAYSSLNVTGGFVIVSSVIVVNTGNETFVALSAVCTHAGCIVTYNLAGNNFPCDCHGSLYSISGSVINGPALSPLASYPVTRSGNILTVNR
jgi:cytochrome b6-f complex iron-sulfur subunit